MTVTRATLQNVKRVMPCLAAVVEELLQNGNLSRSDLAQEEGSIPG